MTNEKLTSILHSIQGLLLDFDGPVAPFMPAPTNFQIAESIREVIRSAGAPLPQSIEQSVDPLSVLRFASSLDPEVEASAERVCRAGELAAAGDAMLTDGARDLFRACEATAMRVVIVSNNSAEAIKAFLDRHSLLPLLAGVFGRPFGHPDLMKPDPYLVNEALEALGLHSETAIMFGDSVSDLQAAQAAGVRCIGYGKNPRRAAELRDAGADLVVDTVAELAAAVRSVDRAV